MDNKYDKIFKENIGSIFLSLSTKYLGIEIASSKELKDKLQTTLEKEVDFLREITTPLGDRLIVQLEFQTVSEKGMVYRMQEYHAILQKKYQLPVRQFVIYLGERPPKMRTKLYSYEVFQEFDLMNLYEIDYRKLLDSDIPEEILLTVLGKFDKAEKMEVLGEIISKLQKLSGEEITLQKYIRQLATLARLRNLVPEAKQKLEDMAIIYDVENDVFFRKGIEKGETQGMDKLVKLMTLMKSGKYTLAEMAQMCDLSLEKAKAFAKKIKDM